MAHPIWKDCTVILSQDPTTRWRIRQGADVIFEGVAYLRPGALDNAVCINDICADYLTHAVPALSQAEFTALTFPLTFDVEVWSGGAWSAAGSVDFLNDWSYDYQYDVERDGMAFPIDGRLDPAMWITFTAYNVADIAAVLTFEDGTTQTVTIPLEVSPDFNSSYNDDFTISARSAGSGTAVFDLSQWSGVVGVEINGIAYRVETDCHHRFALYYLNAYGGWDFLLMRGNFTEADDVDRKTFQRDYDNADIRNRGTDNYVNVLGKRYTLRTGWLSDDASSRMHHLLNSTDVYLYDIDLGQMIPVTLTSPVTEYKRNPVVRAIDYAVEVAVAQERMRR